ncbi:MAG: caspase family protein [Chlorobiaceae bacterium]|jgi:metacaspase-1|nr:caspase family protein [Chlorobiaceae bacterium]NTW64291.1 caspase family protein [Chlorobiaceae bacterium]
MAKKALCVGINKFKNYASATLNGCVNDANEMKSLLVDYFGFTKNSIKILTNAQATKAAIMNELRKMVDGAIAGKYDTLVFSLSSHGTQVPDANGDEPDRSDEAFCPYDLAQQGDQWHPDHVITDDELNSLFLTLPEHVTLEVYLDTCHSGTGLKAIDFLFQRKPRYLPPPSLEAFLDLEGRTLRGLGELKKEKALTRKHILWTGCKASETSADALIDGTWHGAFTYYYSTELRKSKNTLSKDALLKIVRADLKAGRYSQTPQLEYNATTR